ncbi:helix-turn-helix domain-containing protein [Paenibacillus sp. TAB 01]|uniref:AraC family transcriptional regulator n=1 Tax=Paenibacillus sp. TAB 01 TaxID=3368988 RepID=UPI0037506022
MKHSNHTNEQFQVFHATNNKALRLRYKIVSTETPPIYYHYHRGIEILFVHHGIGSLTLNRKMYNLEAGSIVLLHPFQLHRVQFETHTQPYVRTTLTFEPSSFAPLLKHFPVLFRFFEQIWKGQLSVQVFRMGSNLTYISGVLERFHHFVSEPGGDEDLESASMLILNILDYVKSLHNGGFGGAARPESHAEKIMNWVEDHYTEPFDLSTLAEELHLSKHHVSHLFQSETGSSITDYVIARRIRQACWLLKTESKSIEQIGALVGISNFPYFCRLFKKVTGLTPNQYRKSHLN